MVKTKDSTTQKKPAAKKATTKPRVKKALLPPQLARSASLQVKYDVTPDYEHTAPATRTLAPTSSDAPNTKIATLNLPKLTDTSRGFTDAQSGHVTESISTINGTGQHQRIIEFVAQDGSPRSQSGTPKTQDVKLDGKRTEEPEPETETESVVDLRNNSVTSSLVYGVQVVVEPSAKPRSIRFSDRATEGKERGKGIRWEGRDASPVVESTVVGTSALKRRATDDTLDLERVSKAERKRLKGKGKAKEPNTTDERAFQRADTAAHHYVGQPHHVHSAQDYSSSGLPIVPPSTQVAPCLYQSTTPQVLPGIASFGSHYAGVEPAPHQLPPQYHVHHTWSLPPSTAGGVPFQFHQPPSYDLTSSAQHDSGLLSVYERDFGKPPAPEHLGYAISDVRHATAGSKHQPHSEVPQTFPVSESSSSSTCVSRQDDQSFNGGRVYYEAVCKPAMQQHQVPVTSSSQTADIIIDPALTSGTTIPNGQYREPEPLVKMGSSENAAPTSTAPPMFFLPHGISILEYFVHRVSPLCPLEELDLTFYFACCWDGGESMIRSTCALYQQWVSASLQRTEELVNYFHHNHQLIVVRMQYFRTIRGDRMTFNPASRKCDNCHGTSPTLPLPRKDAPSYKYLRLCKDCGEAMFSLQQDTMFRTYTLERRKLVEMHEKGIRKELKEMGFPVDGGETAK